jgi:hypothetical protein
MAKPPFDQQALIDMFETASAKGGDQLRTAVSQTTLQALKGREMTLSNVKGVLKAVSEAASMGAAKNTQVDPEALLDKAVTGMDDALLKAVEAHRTALSTLAAQGADLREKHLKKAVMDLEKMEDTVFGVLKKTAQTADANLGGAWGNVLEKMQAGGMKSGPMAAMTAEQVVSQMESTLKEGRAASMRAAQALAEGYAALVSGVLMGMSEALRAPAAPAPAPAPAAPKASARRKAG